MKYILLNDDMSVRNCFYEYVEGSVEITDLEALKFAKTTRHDELKLENGVLVDNLPVINEIKARKAKKPKSTGDIDAIWQALKDGGIQVVIPQEVLGRLS